MGFVQFVDEVGRHSGEGKAHGKGRKTYRQRAGGKPRTDGSRRRAHRRGILIESRHRDAMAVEFTVGKTWSKRRTCWAIKQKRESMDKNRVQGVSVGRAADLPRSPYPSSTRSSHRPPPLSPFGDDSHIGMVDPSTKPVLGGGLNQHHHAEADERRELVKSETGR